MSNWIVVFLGNWLAYKYAFSFNGKSVNNMKTIISVLFVSILAGSLAFRHGSTDYKYADKDTLAKQSVIYELLQHPYQPGVSIYKPEYLEIVNAFDFEHSYDLFRNVDAIKEFYYYYKKGFIPYHELFSIHHEHHRRQAIALFHVFYYAKGEFLTKFVFFFHVNFPFHSGAHLC